jgi:hypothetical protein
MTNWKKMLEREFTLTGERIEELTFNPSNIDIDQEFDSGYGGVNGESFVAHGNDFVYFCMCYDGREWIESLPRHPETSYKPRHFGGG